MSKVLIAGAGHGGLVAGTLLAREGWDVTVYEAKHEVALGYDQYDSVHLDGFEKSGVPIPEEYRVHRTGLAFRIPGSDLPTLRQGVKDDTYNVEIDRRARAAGRVMPVLVPVDIAREPQKAGIDEDALEAFVRRLSGMDGLRVEGLMAIMPFVDDPETVRPYFRRMREWFERLRDMDIPNVRMNTLSMGMSGDCLVACQEGATMVRLGRALFGERSYH